MKFLAILAVTNKMSISKITSEYALSFKVIFKKCQLLQNPHSTKNLRFFLSKIELSYRLCLKHLYSNFQLFRVKMFQRNSDFEISGLAISEKISGCQNPALK